MNRSDLMEKFRKQLIFRTVFVFIFIVFVTAAYIVIYTNIGEKSVSAAYSSGFCTGLLAVAAVYAARYIPAFKDEEKLKKLYVAENDERERLIREKTASGSFSVCAFILGAGIVISTLVSPPTAGVLAVVLGGMALIKMIFNFYYRRKY